MNSSMQPLQLAAHESNWRLFMLRKADQAFLPFQEKIFTRDAYTCQFCGFQAKQFMDVVNADSDYRNNKMTNMVTACPFCSQCQFLESVGQGQYGGGSLIYCPQLSQAELNALCHVLFCNIANASPNAVEAKNIYRSLRLCSQQVEKHLGEGMSNPAVFGRLYIETEANRHATFNQEIFGKVRLLPMFARFTKQIELWNRDSLQLFIAK